MTHINHSANGQARQQNSGSPRRLLPRGTAYSTGDGWTRLVTEGWFEPGEHGSLVGTLYLAGGPRACLVREPAGTGVG